MPTSSSSGSGADAPFHTRAPYRFHKYIRALAGPCYLRRPTRPADAYLSLYRNLGSFRSFMMPILRTFRRRQKSRPFAGRAEILLDAVGGRAYPALQLVTGVRSLGASGRIGNSV